MDQLLRREPLLCDQRARKPFGGSTSHRTSLNGPASWSSQDLEYIDQMETFESFEDMGINSDIITALKGSYTWCLPTRRVQNSYCGFLARQLLVMRAIQFISYALHNVGCGYDKPSSSQQVGIPAMLAGSTVLVGSRACGKTGAVVIASAQMLCESVSATQVSLLVCVPTPVRSVLLSFLRKTHDLFWQVLVLGPSRDRCAAVNDRLSELTESRNIRGRFLAGGTNIRADVAALRSGAAQFVTGTPGRIADCVARRLLQLDALTVCALVDVDVMVEAGFGPQLAGVLTSLPATARVLATCSDAAAAMTALPGVEPQPRVILARKTTSTVPTGTRLYRVFVASSDDKPDAFAELYETLTIQQAVVYCNTRRHCAELLTRLQARDITVAALSDVMEPLEQEHILREFRAGVSRVLILPDVLASCLDAVSGERMPFLVHYDLPGCIETFERRMWQFGADHSSRKCVCFVTEAEESSASEYAASCGLALADVPTNPASLL